MSECLQLFLLLLQVDAQPKRCSARPAQLCHSPELPRLRHCAALRVCLKVCTSQWARRDKRRASDVRGGVWVPPGSKKGAKGHCCASISRCFLGVGGQRLLRPGWEAARDRSARGLENVSCPLFFCAPGSGPLAHPIPSHSSPARPVPSCPAQTRIVWLDHFQPEPPVWIPPLQSSPGCLLFPVSLSSDLTSAGSPASLFFRALSTVEIGVNGVHPDFVSWLCLWPCLSPAPGV